MRTHNMNCTEWKMKIALCLAIIRWDGFQAKRSDEKRTKIRFRVEMKRVKNNSFRFLNTKKKMHGAVNKNEPNVHTFN